ncbi:MAG: 4-alpha-glucanotransferase [Faecalibacterium sp.]|nr:4-alpha-glucanotransferase [Ruminococcus sp.]MCM1391181.1 4-alpha-glucanotransferase [Ruminococcus sp.]MCM1485964.1 4-alpha-glucanotransferase [Faecalibacterium sp.]
MQNLRTAGVLLHITSLNGKFGLGVMGEEAFSFVDKLEQMQFRYWQVLPLGPVDDSGSPYCSFSAFAGNLALIDPRQLERDGLLTHDEVKANEFDGTIYAAQHQYALKKRLASLRIAFSRIGSDTKELVQIFAEQNPWVSDYAYFSALKSFHDQKPWWLWDEKYAKYDIALKHKEEFRDEIDFYTFTQYVFFTQWRTLKEYANSKGVFLLGDMPIYVSRDSVDVWSNISLFKINPKSLAPKEVAGVPPDYFSQDGQLWGNPLYDWDKMEKDGYKWWIERLRCSLKLYDKIRIDHFRAFASYWAVPAESETAKNGKWLNGPGMKLFNAVSATLGDADIIAEDLGLFGTDVVQLLEDSGFPGMRVIQFGFDPNGDSTHLPHNYPKNSVAYVGTHDNNTILGWLWEASEAERAYALRYCCFGGNNWGDGGSHSGSCRAVIEAVWRSSANTAIVAVQDMCGFGRDARMNTPGTTDDNWGFRISKEALDSIDTAYFNEINSIYRRTYMPDYN